ncbi:hypothetical protein LCGC14_0400530 [marine sediment metagenome]|uniref:Uncharacterized protein n=1 Tax=marine sediment metagenome TaxID=412755 RepID=A0A0F9W628_9ZZZZ
MAKDSCGLKFRLIHLILILLGLFGSGIAAWVWQQAETKVIARDTETMNEEGCKPAKKHEGQIGIIEYRLNSIDKKQETFSVEQKEMRKENEAAFREILKRLPK